VINREVGEGEIDRVQKKGSEPKGIPRKRGVSRGEKLDKRKKRKKRKKDWTKSTHHN